MVFSSKFEPLQRVRRKQTVSFLSPESRICEGFVFALATKVRKVGEPPVRPSPRHRSLRTPCRHPSLSVGCIQLEGPLSTRSIGIVRARSKPSAANSADVRLGRKPRMPAAHQRKPAGRIVRIADLWPPKMLRDGRTSGSAKPRSNVAGPSQGPLGAVLVL